MKNPCEHKLKKMKNAFLLVSSDKLNVNIKIAEGKAGGIDANPEQPIHLASVGKLFTASVIGMLHDKGNSQKNDRL